ncbi:MAG: LytTR family DNA-binding domain-containing protein [Paludibacter sp.]|nr:LytTR family DNA-binding domain-containing protein [Paludibacter sp.]
MKNLIEMLPEDQFIRIYRSYIVPVNKIEQVRNKVISVGDKKIPIGNKYEKDFFSKYLN